MRRGIALALVLVVLLSCQRSKEPFAPEGSVTSTEWQIVDPAGQGMNGRLMSKGYAEAYKFKYVDALLVQRNQVLIGEMYFNGFAKDKAHIVHSVSKSILSAMIGIAIDNGLLNLNDRMLTYLADYDLRYLESRKSEITIKHLLTMTAGYGSDQVLYETIAGSANWVQKTLDTPLTYNPGEKFSYLTFCSHLLSAILTKASGQTSLEFGARNLFSPLNMVCKRWDRDPQGIYFGGNNMYFLPRDLMTFGQLYLDGGRANGRQIVPAAWVEESTKPFYSGSKSWGSLQNAGYGYQWWSGLLSGHPVVFALGHGGQYILLVPDIDLIVVTTADPPYSGNYWDKADEQERAILGIIDTYFVRAAF